MLSWTVLFLNMLPPMAAAEGAMRQAGLVIDPELSERTGVFIGSGIGGFTIIEREHHRVDALAIPREVVLIGVAEAARAGSSFSG